MNIRNIGETTAWFEVLQTTKRTQTAMMTLKPGRASGGHKQGHKNSHQVLLLLEGEVEGEIADDTIRLRKGDVIVIPAGTKHKFTNCGAVDAVTFNTYSPPEYDPTEKA